MQEHRVFVDDLAHPDAELSDCVVRALAEHLELHPKITVLNVAGR